MYSVHCSWKKYHHNYIILQHLLSAYYTLNRIWLLLYCLFSSAISIQHSSRMCWFFSNFHMMIVILCSTSIHLVVPFKEYKMDVNSNFNITNKFAFIYSTSSHRWKTNREKKLHIINKYWRNMGLLQRRIYLL